MCDFICNGEKCNKHKKYGNYCCKHKRLYLVKDNNIIIDRFTCVPSDYLKNDLVVSICKITKQKYPRDKKKDYYFKLYVDTIEKLKKYNQNDIIKIQSNIRRKLLLRNIYLRGKGYLHRNLCNNNEDFFTYESKENIDNDYFISYTDKNNFTWCFDIRSINKLKEYNQGNPYTRDTFPESFFKNVDELTIRLKNKNKRIDLNSEIIQERKNNIKHITVDLFSEIEICGYDCNINWFLDLNIILLKKLYKILEDIWNYRANLSQEAKNNIVPPNGIIFNKSMHYIDRLRNKRELQEIIINDVAKFKTAVNHGDKVTGFMYFLMGLGHVSHQCYNTYPWLLTG